MTKKNNYKIQDEVLVEVTSVYKVRLSDLDWFINLRPETASVSKIKEKLLKQIDSMINYSKNDPIYPILHKVDILNSTLNSRSTIDKSEEEDSNQ